MDRLVECRDCGLVQSIPTLADRTIARCGRCAAVLRRAHHANGAALACAVAGAILFVLALELPFLSVHILRRLSSTTFFSGAEMLKHEGHAELAALMLLTLIAAPAVKLAVTVTVLGLLRAPRPPRWLPWLFGWHERITPWSMIEVFLLGVIVAYTRIQAIGQVEIGASLVAIGGLTLVMTAADSALDPDAVWEQMEARGLTRTGEEDTQGVVFACPVCRRLSRAREGEKCRRCAHTLHARKPNGVLRATALTLGGALLYVPANVLPVMTVARYGKGGPRTILGGIQELFNAHLWPLAILVFVASLLVPILKLLSLGAMILLTRRHSSFRLKERTRLFRLISMIGRWSMIDVFMLTTLVGLLHMGALVTVRPEEGAVAFAAVVVITMFATELFDPRVMWDAASARPMQENGVVP